MRISGMIPDFIRAPQFQRHIPRHAFLQQEVHRADRLFTQKAVDHNIAVQGVGDRCLNHPLMMCHVRRDSDEIAARHDPVRGEIQCFDKTVSLKCALLRQDAQVLGRSIRPTAKRQGRPVRGNHQIIREPPANTKTRHTKGAILKRAARVRGAERGFRYAPRDAPFMAIHPLKIDCSQFAFAQQRVTVAGQEQWWHQVFEHRPVPGQDRWLALQSCDRPAECEPVRDRCIVFGNGKVAGQSGLCRQQIIMAVVHFPEALIVANPEQP